jgi:DNA-binding MarR family transcriptional regulator
LGKQAEIKRSQKIGSVFAPVSRAVSSKALSAQESRKDLLVFWLFKTCIKLQTSLDRRFLRFGMTVQEATVLLRCVEARRISPGRLAIAVGRDKGKITRFIGRLEAKGLIMRDTLERDRRISVIRPTGKGKQVARALASVFDNIRKELFVGILKNDVSLTGKMLQQLHNNAIRIGSWQKRGAVRRRRRIGVRSMNKVAAVVAQGAIPREIVTPLPKRNAVDVVSDEQDRHERELARRGPKSEENASPEILKEETEGLAVK